MDKRQANEIATTKVMTPYVIPFLMGRKTCIKCMIGQGLSEDEAVDIMNSVCAQIQETVDWAENQSEEDRTMTKTKAGKERFMLKALRDLRGVSEDELSDDDARKIIKEVEKELDELK